MSEQDAKTVKVGHLRDLHPDSSNARAHNSRNVGMIEDALGAVGAARSIVIDEDNRVLAGNATIEAAGRVGIERVRVVEADGEEIIAVRRSGLTPEQKKLLAYYDNRTAELADWDADQMLADITAGLDLGDLFRDGELDEILGDLLKDPPEDPDPHLDQKKPVTCPECGAQFVPDENDPNE